MNPKTVMKANPSAWERGQPCPREAQNSRKRLSALLFLAASCGFWRLEFEKNVERSESMNSFRKLSTPVPRLTCGVILFFQLNELEKLK